MRNASADARQWAGTRGSYLRADGIGTGTRPRSSSARRQSYDRQTKKSAIVDTSLRLVAASAAAAYNKKNKLAHLVVDRRAIEWRPEKKHDLPVRGSRRRAWARVEKRRPRLLPTSSVVETCIVWVSFVNRSALKRIENRRIWRRLLKTILASRRCWREGNKRRLFSINAGRRIFRLAWRRRRMSTHRRRVRMLNRLVN